MGTELKYGGKWGAGKSLMMEWHPCLSVQFRPLNANEPRSLLPGIASDHGFTFSGVGQIFFVYRNLQESVALENSEYLRQSGKNYTIHM